LQHFLSSLDYPNKDASLVFGADPLIVGSTRHVVGPSHHILGKALHPDERPGAKP
ncbi:MAG: polyphosphate kinase 2, partial [Hyphomicrobiales bacterium]|nr:polyphosphate kinase 2 [Hyphomicrobiales bacterium]